MVPGPAKRYNGKRGQTFKKHNLGNGNVRFGFHTPATSKGGERGGRLERIGGWGVKLSSAGGPAKGPDQRHGTFNRARQSAERTLTGVSRRGGEVLPTIYDKRKRKDEISHWKTETRRLPRWREKTKDRGTRKKTRNQKRARRERPMRGKHGRR